MTQTKVTKIKCTACGVTSEIILQAQKGILWYEYDLDQESWEAQEHEGNEVMGYYCKNCGNAFDEKTSAELDAIINE